MTQIRNSIVNSPQKSHKNLQKFKNRPLTALNKVLEGQNTRRPKTAARVESFKNPYMNLLADFTHQDESIIFQKSPIEKQNQPKFLPQR